MVYAISADSVSLKNIQVSDIRPGRCIAASNFISEGTIRNKFINKINGGLGMEITISGDCLHCRPEEQGA